MRSSIDDVLDKSGSFSPEKVRATGAIDLIKKLRQNVKTTHDKDGNIHITKTVEIEMLSSAEAREQLARYLGMRWIATPKLEGAGRKLLESTQKPIIFHQKKDKVEG